MEDKQIEYKYNEKQLIEEIEKYINNTYGEHYSKNKYQATEFIIDSGLGTGFCMGNVLKYAQRYGRKGTRDDWRKDLLKVIHYAIIQLYVHDEETKASQTNISIENNSSERYYSEYNTNTLGIKLVDRERGEI